jgi:phage terminase large subunit
MNDEKVVNVTIPKVFQFLFQPHRYKSAYGGRGGAKSWAYADALLMLGRYKSMRILCTREYQNTILDSVHKLLSDRIKAHGMEDFYEIQKNIIKGSNGTEFIFKGLHNNIDEIKSTEGIDKCWIEEAQSVSERSWAVLIPTIRKEDSEIWLTWNTGEKTDPTYQRFVVNPPPDCVSIKVGWRDNPFFPETLNKERLYCKMVDPDAYQHIWQGDPLFLSDALIFKDKFVVEAFESPRDARFLYGADWGFSQDPTVLVRSFIQDDCLYVDHAVHGVGVELDEIPQLFDAIPESRDHLIKADSARPETISHIKNKGFTIVSCRKWNGSVQDGIAHMRMYKKIYVHPRCEVVIDEMQHYSYKTDRKTEEVLPVVVDKMNHSIDAIRYSLEDQIQGTIDWEALVA